MLGVAVVNATNIRSTNEAKKKSRECWTSGQRRVRVLLTGRAQVTRKREGVEGYVLLLRRGVGRVTEKKRVRVTKKRKGTSY